MSALVHSDKASRWGILAALVVAIAALCLVLAGCSAGSGSAESDEAGSSDTAEEQKTPVVILSHDREAAALNELVQVYLEDHDDLDIQIQSATSDKKLSRQLKSNYRAVQKAGSSDESDSESSSSLDAQTEAAEPVAAVVGLSAAQRDEAEDAQWLSASTDTDLLQDSLVIVTAKQRSLTTRDLISGEYRLGMVPADTTLGTLQYETLHSLGATTTTGRFVGPLAAKGKTKEYGSVVKLFSGVANGKKTAALVLRSDVYRYGGVKVSGEVPADAYTAPVYAYALTAYASDEQTEAASDFLNWSVTDADGLRIWKKWGFEPAA